MDKVECWCIFIFFFRADSIANFLCDCSGIILGMFPALVVFKPSWSRCHHQGFSDYCFKSFAASLFDSGGVGLLLLVVSLIKNRIGLGRVIKSSSPFPLLDYSRESFLSFLAWSQFFFADHLAVLEVARNADLYPRFDSDDCFNLVPVLLQGRYCCFIGVGSTLLASLASFGYSCEFADFWVQRLLGYVLFCCCNSSAAEFPGALQCILILLVFMHFMSLDFFCHYYSISVRIHFYSGIVLIFGLMVGCCHWFL